METNNLTHPEVFYLISLPVALIFIAVAVQSYKNWKRKK